jgi:hypothetical protein
MKHPHPTQPPKPTPDPTKAGDPSPSPTVDIPPPIVPFPTEFPYKLPDDDKA